MQKKYEGLRKIFKETDSVIAVYGTGKLALEFMPLWKEIGVSWFVDRNFNRKIGMYEVCSFEEAVEKGTTAIIIAATAGNTRIIYERIIETCSSNNIKLYSLYGNDLSQIYSKITQVHESNYTVDDIKAIVNKYESITVKFENVMMTYLTLDPEDIYEIVESKAKKMGIEVKHFRMQRIRAERNAIHINSLDDIYRELSILTNLSSEEMRMIMAFETETRKKLTVPREDVIAVLNYAIEKDKKINVLMPKYDSEECNLYIPEIDSILQNINVKKFCVNNDRYAIYREIKEKDGNSLIISDEIINDGYNAIEVGMEALIIESVKDMIQKSTIGEVIPYLRNVNEKSIVGMIATRIYNSPFIKVEDCKVYIKDAKELAYCFMAPLLVAFVLWICDMARQLNVDEVLFGARDGFLFHKMYEYLIQNTNCNLPKARYIYTSRTAAITAAVESLHDLEEAIEWYGKEIITRMYGTNDTDEMLQLSRKYRNNYKKYLETNGIAMDKKYAFVDLDSCGSVQYYLSKLGLDLTGLYCHQYIGSVRKPPDIYAMTSSEMIDGNKNLLQEALIGSDDAMTKNFDDVGNPVFDADNRNEKSIDLIRINVGETMRFWKKYIDDMHIDIEGGEVSPALVNRIEDICRAGEVIISKDILNEICIDDGVWGGRSVSNCR